MRTTLRNISLALAALALTLLACACGSGGNGDFTSPNIAQRSLAVGEGATIALTPGDSLTIPAGTFDRATIVSFADQLTGGDAATKYSPTTTQAAADLLAAV